MTREIKFVLGFVRGIPFFFEDVSCAATFETAKRWHGEILFRKCFTGFRVALSSRIVHTFSFLFPSCRFAVNMNRSSVSTKLDRDFSPTVPPDISDDSTSTDMVVREGSNVSLRCEATGSPKPNITWRREDGELINLGNNQEGKSLASYRNSFKR